MSSVIENADIRLEVKPESGRWSVEGRYHSGPVLENVQVNLWCRRGRSRFRFGDHWRELDHFELSDAPSGPGRQPRLHFSINTGSEDINCVITFALLQERPFLLWLVELENRGKDPITVENIEMLTAGFIYRDRIGPPGVIHLHHATSPTTGRRGSWGEDLAFYSNGWQSWSYTGIYSSPDHYQTTRLGPLRLPVIHNVGTPRPWRAGLFASDMFGVLGDRRTRSAVLVGFLSQRQHFGSLECWIGNSPPALRMWANGDGARLDPGHMMSTDWAYLQFLHLDDADPLAVYTGAVASENGLMDLFNHQTTPSGWCSWYQFSGEDYSGTLKATDIQENLQSMIKMRDKLPFDVVQIDDGFEAEVGDWNLFKESFPGGVVPLARKIRESGFRPGLWLAPFIAHPNSRLVRSHPEWVLRNRLGLPVNAGFLWGSFARALDLTHPDVMAYTREVIETAVREWGFSYLKLDFLYAAALPGRHFDPTQTRAQVLRTALETIRQAAGEETFLLGCGCPLGPAIGLVDAMRIGADTARRWYPSYKGIEVIFKSEVTFPAARNACQNALTRAALHRRWWINDPDCLLVRLDTNLTLTEVQTVATVIALSGGSFFLSDHLPVLPPERLRIARCLLPVIGRRPFILDWFDSQTPERLRLDLEGAVGSWYLFGLFNWSDQAKTLKFALQELSLPPGIYHAREFWRGEVYNLHDQHPLQIEIQPHGVVLFSVRSADPRRAQYLGSDLHISQGLEVVTWNPHLNGVIFRLERPGECEGQVDLFLPHPIQQARQDGRELTWEDLAQGVNRLSVNFTNTTTIEIDYAY